MIKLNPREMNKLSRILSVMLCLAPVAYASAGPVATTAGNNLTAYNPSNAMNNQWATMSNGRYDNTSAKADFGNCNSLILRCAQPKCANGGCSDMSVAGAIVKGCVQSNKTCTKYGDDLVQYMSAQLVATSNAKVNEQNAAAQQAAAQAAAQQSQQQMQQMQYQMQQMQQQMAQQQAESQQQLQAALAQQAAQSQSAIESMKAAATEAAKQNEAGISAYQQEAIDRGISTDIIERQKITGQIMTEIENAEVSLEEIRRAMTAAFDYAGCDARGNNCIGPKRVKKWRELAVEFLTPYDNTIDKIYDALVIAQTVGVPLSDIYMMLNNSCNTWGQYMCPQNAQGSIIYADASNGKKSMPYVCNTKVSTTNSNGQTTLSNPYNDCLTNSKCSDPQKSPEDKARCNNDCLAQYCQQCTLLKVLTSEDDVYEGWVNAESNTTSGNTTVVACASGALDSSALFARRTKNKNGAGLVDIDKLDTWLNQIEPTKKYNGSSTEPMAYCNVSGHKEKLEKSALSRIVPTKGTKLCVDGPGRDVADNTECAYISPIYAICDTHLFNIGMSEASAAAKKDSDDCTQEEINNSGIEGKDHVKWAQKRGSVCGIVKFCDAGYKVKEDKACEQTTEDAWQTGGDSYNGELRKYEEHVRAEFSEVREVVGLKTTVISQQMYKQYEYIKATLRRLKTQLEKATLTATLEAAGAKSDDSSSSGLLGGGSKNSQYRDCSGKSMQGTLDCLRENYSVLNSRISSKKCQKEEKAELVSGISIANDLFSKEGRKIKDCEYEAGKTSATCSDQPTGIDYCKKYLTKYSSAMTNLQREISDDKAKQNGRYRNDDDD